MKGVWKFSLSLSLGLLTGAAWADEVQWRSAVARPDVPPAVQTQPAPAEPAPRPPAVSLALPVRNTPPARPVVDPLVRPVTLSTATPVVRGQSAEPPRAMPAGPPTVEPGESLDKPPTKIVPSPTVGPSTMSPGTVVLPFGTTLPQGQSLPPGVVIAPSPGGPVVSGPSVVPPGMVVPDGMPHTVMQPGMVMPDGMPVEGGPMLGLPVGPGGEVVGPEGVVDEGSMYPTLGYTGSGMACVTAESGEDGDGESDEEGRDVLGSRHRFYGRAEYLLWWTKNSPPGGAVRTNVGTFGGNRNGSDLNSGGRFTIGYQFLESRALAVEGTYLLSGLGNNDNVIPNNHAHNMLMGGEVNVVGRVLGGPNYRVSLLGGFRYLGMWDSFLFVNQDVMPPQNRNIQANDHFFGGQIGVQAEYRLGKFIFDLRGKCALGETVQGVDVNGQPVGVPPPREDDPHHNNSHTCRFGVVPEATATIGYQITDWWKVQVGYNFLYWNKVVRAADQTNLATTPSFGGRNNTDFWAQGLTFGMEFRF